ncbi:MAG TPA: hypothetical protein VMN82_04770 [Thermoanaerobaculia bacterium]|nr:hypothetical protein [Thermoanaerobaculia bacterium]
MLPSGVPRKRLAGAVFLALAASLLPAGTDLLPERVAEVSRQVEQVRGRKFERPVPAVELDPAEARRILKAKIVESLPSSAEEYFRSLAILGLIEDAPGVLDRLVDFYAGQVVAFYDPEPRRFFVVRGAEGAVSSDVPGMAGLAQSLIYSHELMHALQDETMKLDARTKALKDDSDRGFALQALLEGEATFVMIKVALKDIPGADEKAEEELAPLLTSGGLERANVPKGVPAYFVDQLFFPYAEGSAFVRAAYEKGGWAEVDRFWRNPPASSAEIIHGAPYPPPVEGLIPPNPASLFGGARVVYTDTLGEWTLRFLLGRALPEEEAAAASAGWRGDRIAFAVPDGKMGYLWRIRFDDAAAAERFEAAIKKARAARPLPLPETVRRSGRDVTLAVGLAKIPEL